VTPWLKSSVQSNLVAVGLGEYRYTRQVRTIEPLELQGHYHSISGYSYNNLLYVDYGVVREILWSDADCVIVTTYARVELPLSDIVVEAILSFNDPLTLRLVQCTNTRHNTFFTLITPKRYQWIQRLLQAPPHASNRLICQSWQYTHYGELHATQHQRNHRGKS
jgi:hypothetical protein